MIDCFVRDAVRLATEVPAKDIRIAVGAADPVAAAAAVAAAMGACAAACVHAALRSLDFILRFVVPGFECPAA
jgi:hypothetical protein